MKCFLNGAIQRASHICSSGFLDSKQNIDVAESDHYTCFICYLLKII